VTGDFRTFALGSRTDKLRRDEPAFSKKPISVRLEKAIVFPVIVPSKIEWEILPRVMSASLADGSSRFKGLFLDSFLHSFSTSTDPGCSLLSLARDPRARDSSPCFHDAVVLFTGLITRPAPSPALRCLGLAVAAPDEAFAESEFRFARLPPRLPLASGDRGARRQRRGCFGGVYRPPTLARGWFSLLTVA
jgi:hypothetical protein